MILMSSIMNFKGKSILLTSTKPSKRVHKSKSKSSSQVDKAPSKRLQTTTKAPKDTHQKTVYLLNHNKLIHENR